MIIGIALIVIFFSIVGCIRSKKLLIKMCLGIMAILCVIIICFTVGYGYVTQYKITGVDSTFSPNGNYELFLQEVGEPDWPFGHTHARVVLNNGKKTVSTYSFDVANDGGRMNSNQWHVEWKEDYVEIIIHGEEQNDSRIILNYNGDIDIP